MDMLDDMGVSKLQVNYSFKSNLKAITVQHIINKYTTLMFI